MTPIYSCKRELGLVFRDAGVLSDLDGLRIVGWHRDFAMQAAFERSLLALALSHPQYVRAARTHSAVAAAVASGRADVGFVERQAALEAWPGAFKTHGAMDEIKICLARAQEEMVWEDGPGLQGPLWFLPSFPPGRGRGL
jgi:Periplasmic molybdate-binding protein/domain